MKDLYEELSKKNKQINNLNLELNETKGLVEKKNYELKKETEKSMEIFKQYEMNKKQNSRMEINL